MTPLRIELVDEAATRRLGAALGRLLPDGAVVALNGPLGAGKTRLVQGLAEACGIDPREVVSPTFTLVQEHRGTRRLYHFDAYRLRDDDEFLALGADEYFAAGGLALVEWAEKVPACLPAEHLEIRLTPLGETHRRAELTAFGDVYANMLQQLADLL
jgi:tRNA threonylcarbamoyladenosine biosynthesis protein TsaE